MYSVVYSQYIILVGRITKGLLVPKAAHTGLQAGHTSHNTFYASQPGLGKSNYIDTNRFQTTTHNRHVCVNPITQHCTYVCNDTLTQIKKSFYNKTVNCFEKCIYNSYYICLYCIIEKSDFRFDTVGWRRRGIYYHTRRWIFPSSCIPFLILSRSQREQAQCSKDRERKLEALV